MVDGWTILIASLAYLSLLFSVAWAGDAFIRSRKTGGGRPLTYSLSLAVYCTSWTFFGSVGLAVATGWDFLPVYLGPILVFTLGWRFIQRLVRLAKSQNTTSVADFLAARYGKSQAVAAIVTLVAIAGTLPYIALQLKAVVISVETLLGHGALDRLLHAGPLFDTAFLVALVMSAFAVLFGTRHIDATEHQEGLMLAIATESIVKLAAFIAVGVFVVQHFSGGFAELVARIAAASNVNWNFTRGFQGGTWLTVALLSTICILLLPRQFHVTVVENNSERELERARWLFPTYLVLINLFVVPIAATGMLELSSKTFNPDMLVLALPLAAQANQITMLAFIGGLSAATAMIIVESVALAIMTCNGLIVPLLLARKSSADSAIEGMASTLLTIRRIAIVAIIFLGYAFYRALGQVHGLAAIGLVSFAAISQLAPSFFGGLVWRRATARGAIAGILAGFTVWAYTLLVPWIARAGWLPVDLLREGPFGIGVLRPEALFYLQFEPLTHGVIWSLAVNTIAYVSASLLKAPEPIERLQAHAFVLDDDPRPASAPSFRIWRTTITIADLQQTLARYLGPDRAERAFQEFAESRHAPLTPTAEADIGLIRFTEHLLASAIGAASARLVLSLLLRRSNIGSQSALSLLDDATEALQYNRDLLQSALDQVRHGLGVFDRDMRLICWNREFRELLDLPAEVVRVGVPMERVIRSSIDQGGLGGRTDDAAVASMLVRFAEPNATFLELADHGRRVIEVRTSPMPQGGVVATFSNITERVQAAEQLARANEFLERRVAERTAELTEVNRALAAAKTAADAANLDKTRFVAAASHDISQPLNAARLYAASLAERPLARDEAAIAQNIDTALQSVEEIFGTLIEISRLDAGGMRPEFAPLRLSELLEGLAIEMLPVCREKGIELRLVMTGASVVSDRRLLRRLLQNLVSNAVKYTESGGILIGCRRAGGGLRIEIWDTGPGIPENQLRAIFEEFHRLDQTSTTTRGLGLGLSIVDRIRHVLGHEVSVRSWLGRGSCFAVAVPLATVPALPRPVRQRAAPGIDITGVVCLCIDNEPRVLDGMRALLDGWGATTITGHDLEDALAALARAEPGGGLEPDIVLADYHLDNGRTGIEAIAGLRARFGAALPAVVVTADHSRGVRDVVAGADAHLLRKPIKTAALRALVGQVARRRAQAAE